MARPMSESKRKYLESRGKKTNSTTINDSFFDNSFETETNKNTEKWKDFYNIPQKENYIHSNKYSFEYILSKNNMSAKDILKDTEKNLANVIILVYEDILKYWENLRNIFIKTFVDKGLTKETDPNKFLEIFNDIFTDAISSNVTQKILTWKSSNVEIYGSAGALKDTSALEKNKKKIENAFDNLIDMLIELVNYHDSYLEEWNSMIFNEPVERRSDYGKFGYGREFEYTKDGKKIKKKEYPFSVLLDNIKTLASILGINANSTTELIKEIQKYKDQLNIMAMTNPDQALAHKEFAIHASSKQSITNKFTHFISGVATAPIGYVGLTDSIATIAEYTSQDALSKSILANKNLKGLDITNLQGVALSDKTTIDQILVSVETDKDTLYFGSSWKLRNEPILKSQYAKSNYEDFLPKDKQDFLYWFRRNYLALGTWERSGDMYFLGDISPKEYIDFETTIASLMALPRMLDGIIDYTDGVALKDFNGSKYHNALIMLDNKTWTWVYDIMVYMIDGMKKDYKSLGISGALGGGSDLIKSARGKIEENIKSINPGELKDLWEKKKSIIKKFGRSTRYDLLYNGLANDMQGIVNQSFARAPIEGIYLTLNLGKYTGGHK